MNFLQHPLFSSAISPKLYQAAKQRQTQNLISDRSINGEFSNLHSLEFKKLFLDNVHIFVYFVIMKIISFYRTGSGKCPVKEHLDSLTDVQATKIASVLKLIRELDQIPSKYFKKLGKTNDIWEARVDVGKNTFRLLGFFSWSGVDYINQLLPKEGSENTR